MEVNEEIIGTVDGIYVVGIWTGRGIRVTEFPQGSGVISNGFTGPLIGAMGPNIAVVIGDEYPLDEDNDLSIAARRDK